jgi:hypothetical protein
VTGAANAIANATAHAARIAAERTPAAVIIDWNFIGLKVESGAS